MLRLAPDLSEDRALNVLCLGAHSDDIEIGAGGTILTLLQRHRAVRVTWVVFSAAGERAEEAWSGARDFLSGAEEVQIVLEEIRDGFFPAEFAQLKERFERLKRETVPDVIFTHAREDHHQDHRLVAELTWNTFREHLVLGYEIPKYDPDMGNPNLFMPLSEKIAERKVAALMRNFASQRARRWFSAETFRGLMRVRGVQAAAPSGLAEGFVASKMWF